MGDDEARITKTAMAGDSVAISGYVLRKVQRNDKWVRRWLQTHGYVLCSYNTSPRGDVLYEHST